MSENEQRMRELRARRGKKPWVVVWFIWPRKRRPERAATDQLLWTI